MPNPLYWLASIILVAAFIAAVLGLIAYAVSNRVTRQGKDEDKSVSQSIAFAVALIAFLMVSLCGVCLFVLVELDYGFRPNPLGIGIVTPGTSLHISGTIIAEDRSQTDEGICQISEYYTLIADSGARYVLDNPRDPIRSERNWNTDEYDEYTRAMQKLQRLIDRGATRVTVEGQVQTLELSSGILCTWIRISDVRDE